LFNKAPNWWCFIFNRTDTQNELVLRLSCQHEKPLFRLYFKEGERMRIAIIGSNRGIGLEFVKQLSEENEVYAFCRESSPELNVLKTTRVIEGFDTTDSKAMESKLSEFNNFDWVIVVSAVLSSESLEQWSDEGILTQFKVNSLGAINCARLFSSKVKEHGKIAVLSSRMGSIADNDSGGMYGYRMSKAAINAGCKSLAEDLKDQGKTVLILHPGYVKTDMTNHNGNLDTKESVEGLVQILKTKDIKETGTFWHTNGEALPW
jgi:NAD(P)-dependent dehydrogenase (short-subunit alcohol dehydrogenase family)